MLMLYDYALNLQLKAGRFKTSDNEVYWIVMIPPHIKTLSNFQEYFNFFEFFLCS